MQSGANWKPGFGYASAALKDGHSLANEKQAYNGGKNTFFVNGNMEIELREETKKAAAWDAKKGFIEKTFSYTSDVMNTKAAFEQEQGLFMVKMRSQGAGCHFLGLTSGKNGQPMVALHFYNGKKVQMGMVANGQSRLAKLSGASRSKYYVYSLRWTAEELIWYVNNLEVFRMANTLTKDQLFFLAQSFLPSTAKAGEGKMQVEWMRVYKCAE
jgi:beta-glucanase (GH16 family)